MDSTKKNTIFCTKCGAAIPNNSIFCNTCGAKVDAGTPPNQDSAQKNNHTNYKPPEGKQSNHDQGLMSQLWHNESFGRAAIQFARVMNYVYLILIFLYLVIKFSQGNFFWGIMIIGWICFAVKNIKKANKRKRDRLYTTCPKCNKADIKIGTKFCTNCGEPIPVQTIEPEDLDATAQKEGFIWENAPKGSLNRMKIGLLCAIAIGLLLLMYLFSGFASLFNSGNNLPESQAETIAAASNVSAALKSDGTVVTIEGDEYWYSGWGGWDANTWTDIVSITAGPKYLVGLKSDGTVEATGVNEDGQCNVEGWTDIVAIAAGEDFTFGLKSDGTVVVTENAFDVYDLESWVDDWRNIVAISVGNTCTCILGLKSNGTVVTAGWAWGKDEIETWDHIVDISTGHTFSIGLKSDGTVVSAGYNNYGDISVEDWTDIVAISAGKYHAVGVKSDGTVVAVGDNSNGQSNVSEWTDIVAVSAGTGHTLGLKSDGTVVAVGHNYYGVCDVFDWSDIMIYDK